MRSEEWKVAGRAPAFRRALVRGKSSSAEKMTVPAVREGLRPPAKPQERTSLGGEGENAF
jgi:hypothetical protein